MIKAKGPILKSVLKYIKGHLGESGYEAFLKTLPEDIQKVLARPILTSEFYPSDIIVGIMDAYVKQGDLDAAKVFHDMGRVSADEGFTGIYKIFLKVGSPAMMIRQAPLIFKSYYSQGKMEAEVVSKNDANVKITGAEFGHPALCTRITGFIERTMELSGGKSVRLTHTKCESRGDDEEFWYGLWE
ncbi:MAG TPA: hypothetical protein PK014_00495 [Thermoanaerobaculia bacterium]|nr:hypothetical protein [Thermoanaerobaculia bacterium]HXK66950.1 hypothetical protein [Thermoanaerobaculia bacterium]